MDPVVSLFLLVLEQTARLGAAAPVDTDNARGATGTQCLDEAARNAVQREH